MSDQPTRAGTSVSVTAESAAGKGRTRLTKHGEPVMGTHIDLLLTNADGSKEWEAAKVVGKGWDQSRRTLLMVVVEWDDGVRQQIPNFPDIEWRLCG